MKLLNPIPKICTYCEYRHGGPCSGPTYDKECLDFVLGRCITCNAEFKDDKECISHRHVYDFCGCDRCKN